MARVKTKAGDGLPVDVCGKFIGQGDIVVMSRPDDYEDEKYIQPLGFGYVEKLGRGYADVRYFSDMEGVSLQITNPHLKLIVIRPDDLNSSNPFFEHIKMEAAKNRIY